MIILEREKIYSRHTTETVLVSDTSFARPPRFIFYSSIVYSNFNLNHSEPSIVTNKLQRIAITGVTLSKLSNKKT